MHTVILVSSNTMALEDDASASSYKYVIHNVLLSVKLPTSVKKRIHDLYYAQQHRVQKLQTSYFIFDKKPEFIYTFFFGGSGHINITNIPNFTFIASALRRLKNLLHLNADVTRKLIVSCKVHNVTASGHFMFCDDDDNGDFQPPLNLARLTDYIRQRDECYIREGNQPDNRSRTLKIRGHVCRVTYQNTVFPNAFIKIHQRGTINISKNCKFVFVGCKSEFDLLYLASWLKTLISDYKNNCENVC